MEKKEFIFRKPLQVAKRKSKPTELTKIKKEPKVSKPIVRSRRLEKIRTQTEKMLVEIKHLLRTSLPLSPIKETMKEESLDILKSNQCANKNEESKERLIDSEFKSWIDIYAGNIENLANGNDYQPMNFQNCYEKAE